jgi:hypothetical protein
MQQENESYRQALECVSSLACGFIDRRTRNAGISIPSHAMLNRQSTLGGTTVAGSRPASVSSILGFRRRAEADKYAA